MCAFMENISGTCWSTTVLRVYIQQGDELEGGNPQDIHLVVKPPS